MLSNKVLELQLQQNSRQDQPILTNLTSTIEPTKSQHEIPIDQKPPPYRSSIERASFLSLLHFFFGVKLIRKVNALKNRTLTIQDLEPIGETESCEHLEKLFTKYYKEYSKKYPKKRRVMTFTLLRIFKKNVWIQAIWQFLFAIGRLMVAYFVYLIIYALKSYSSPVDDCYLAMIGFSLCSILAFYANNQWNFNASYMVNQMQSGILGMLFRKISKLGPHSVNALNLGKLINVTANDLNNLDRIAFVVSLLIAPLVIGAAVGLLWYFWGASSWVGIGYLIFVWIIQWSFAYPTTKYRRGKSGILDERIRMLEESIGAIRLVKMYGWEWNCINAVEKIRAEEIKKLKTFNFMDSVPRAFTFSSHWIAAFLIYVTYTAIEGHIDPSKTFATILILTLLRQSVEINIFNCFLMFIEMKLLFTRTMSIMDLPEVSLATDKKPKPLNPENSIEFQEFSAFWEDIEDPPENAKKQQKEGAQSQEEEEEVESERPPILSNINLQIKKGSLTMVVGKVGSGKSSLLLSITNEIPSYAGIVRCQGSYAYVGQNPILFYGPLRDSVVFGRAYDEDLFWRVLDVCCLTEDVRKLPDKEMSEIGERGIILTGSQRTRLVLARALYREVDIYLLDDPLIGIDVKLAKKVFRNAIMGYLKEKTVVVVTHRYRFLHYADKVVLIDKGEIVAEGAYHELKQHEIFGGCDHRQEAHEVDIPTITTIPPEIPPDVRTMRKRSTMMRKMSIYQRDDEEETMLPSPQASANELAPPELDEGLFVEEEKLDDGRVTYKGYYNYFKAMFTKWNFLPLIILFIGAESIAWLFLVMVGKWARGEYSNTAGMIVVGCLSALGLILNLLKFPLYYNATLNVSHRFHNYMARGMFLSSFKFFDKNSLGRIISRFSNEIGILDKFLIGSLLDVLEGLSLFLNYLFTLWILEPWILVSAAIGVICYVIVYFWGRRTFNQTRGLELITRAPLYSLFLIEVEGLTIIRARKQTEDMIKTFYRQVDDHSRANIAYMVSVRLMSFLIGYAVELIVIGTFCVFIPVDNTPLSRGYFINIVTLLPTTMQWILQSFIVLNLMMSSVARIFTFCENRSSKGLLAARRQPTIRETKDEWPETGEIELKNVNMRYTNKSERFLKDLSLKIESGEKVAVICGSRGGVSHITALLLRMFEIDKVEGEESFVKIDGRNIKYVDYDRLRKAVLVIPQNLYMIGIFSGTIRKNLDPWDQHLDEEIWKALEEVELKEYVEGLKGKLNTKVGKGVSVFSVGQKNLLSIARAILRGGKIIIQDETTTHVDIKTNHIVQKNIERLYKDCTLITITHRLDDIAKYDKVLLIENGEKIEFDEPYRLLVVEIGDTEITNKKGAFASLVKSLGTEMQELFIQRSMKHYYKKHGSEMKKEEDVADAEEKEGL